MLTISAVAHRGMDVVRLRPAGTEDPAPRRVEPAARCASVRADRRSDFLAHLIAVRDGLEQTRRHRRADSSVAISAYRHTAELTIAAPAAPGVIA
jgi:hypothetical protein